MTAADLLIHLRMLDVSLAVDGGRLRVNAPKTVLTPELRDAIAGSKAQLIDLMGDESRGAGSAREAPLSFAQTRMWLLDQIQANTAAYAMQGALRLQGSLDVRALQRAINEIVRRHAILRTTFRDAPGGPVQVVHAFRPLELEVENLPAAGEDRESVDERLLQSRARALVAERFDLEHGPLFRMRLLACGPQDHVLLTAAHHIVSDGWSTAVLARELCVLYAAVATGQRSPLPELPLQYADFATWQRRVLQGEVLAGHLAYWRERLAPPLPVLDLPTDRPRPAQQTFAGAEVSLPLDAEVGDLLRRLGEAEQATGFMLLLAAFQAWLHRYTGQPDVVVGTPVAQRDRLALEGLIGFFANTLVLRSDVADDPTFRQFLQRAKDDLLAAQAHQELPFEKLVEELNPARDPSRNPLFQAMVMVQHADERALPLPGLVATPARWGQGTSAKFDVTALFRESAGRYTLVLEYNTDLFDTATAHAMARRLAHLVLDALRFPDRPIHALAMIDDEEAARLVAGAWGPRRDYDRAPVPAVVARQSARFGDRPAVRTEEVTLSYAQLVAQAGRVAAGLRRLGVRPGDCVAVCVPRDAGLVTTLLGVWQCGAAYVPLDPSYPAERIAYVLGDAQAAALICGGGLAARSDSGVAAASGPKGLPVLDLAVGLPDPDGIAPGPVAPQDLAYVLYTSGSTGRPKGVEITHAALANFIDAMRQEPGLREDDVLLAVTTIAFDIAGLELWLPLTTGATLHLAPAHAARDPRVLQDLLGQSGATTMQATPATWRLLLESGWRGRAGFVALCGGEALPPALAAGLLPRVGALWNLYGPTETTVWSSVRQVVAGEPILIGAPIQNTSFHVRSPDGQLLPDGLPGELWIGGAGLARGYRGNPELTAERFCEDPYADDPAARIYRTGDRVRRRRDGSLVYLGRLDHQLKIRGYRIEPGEIEALLAALPDVREALVLAHEGAGELQLAAYVAHAGPSPAFLDAATLKDYLRRHLPDYMVPASLVVVDAIPRMPNGKVDRAALLERSSEREATNREAAGEGSGTPWDSPTEEVLAGIWREVLHLEKVARGDDFFELGGHSLLATQVASRLRLAFQVELPLSLLFEARTLERLAARVDEVSRETLHADILPRIRPLQDADPVRLSFSQERMWVIHELDPSNRAYNMALVGRLLGELDVDALAAGFDEVRHRHEPLRSTYALHDDVPVQKVQPWVSQPLVADDLRTLGEAAPARAVELAQEMARAGFDLGSGPVFRIGLWRVADQEHVLALALHHIAGDHWSFPVIAREAGTVYAAVRSGRPVRLPDLPISYRDYSRWQRQWLQGEVLERQLAYWCAQLEGVTPLPLPFDHPFPDVPTFAGGRHAFDLPPGLLPRLEAVGRAHGATLFMTTFAAFVAVLHRISGQPDIVLGVPIANRRQVDIEGLVGTFVNTLVMRVDLNEAPRFADVLNRVRAVALDAYAHQDMPFEKLVETLVRQRDAQRPPLVQVLFNVLNAPMRVEAINDLRWELLQIDRGAAQFELSVGISPWEDGRVVIEYRSQLFDRATIECLASCYLEVLQAVAADAAQPVALLKMVSFDQRQRLRQWNATTAPLPGAGLVASRVRGFATRHPERIAVCYENEPLSYAELEARSNRLAHRLRGLGVSAGVLVGVCLPRSIDLVVALLAVQKSGGAYVPLDPGFPQDRLAWMLADSGAGVLLTAPRSEVDIDTPAGLRVIDLDASLQEPSGRDDDPGVAIEATDPAYVIYTSGSTGRPKGVVVPHGALANFLSSMQREPGIGEQDVLAAVTTVSFDIAGLELYLPWVAGARVELISPETAADGSVLARQLAASGATILQATPATWHLLVEAGWRGPPGFKALCGGEPLPRPLADALLDRVAGLWNLYGPTETTIWSTAERVEPGGGPITIGRPIANTRIHVLDRGGQQAPIGIAGEIWIGGAGVASCYHNRPDLTAERFIPEPFCAPPGATMYRTGDLGRWRADGRLEHLGRLDDQVKVRGFRIELGEIEAVLAQLQGVRRAVVVAREVGYGDTRLVAYVCYVPGEDATPSEVRRHLRQSLPDYMIPSIIVPIDSMPMTPNGKVDRAALPDAFLHPGSTERVDEPPAPGVEELLAGVWREILKVERVSANDNFFDLGGHSLLSVRVAAAVHQAMGWRMDPRTLFFQSLRQVASAAPSPAPRE